jgi:hypothetical protein
MRPSSIAPGLNKPGFSEVGQVTGNFWLIGAKHRLKMAHAHLAMTDKAEKAQPGLIGKRGMEKC